MYELNPEGAVENEEVKVLWDIVQCDNMIEGRKKTNIIAIYKKERKVIFIDIAVAADLRVEEKEREKMEKYQDLKRKIGTLRQLKMVEEVDLWY